MTGLDGRAAIVVGANGRIGNAVAERLARAGARLTVTGRDLGALRALAQRLPGDVTAITVDVLDDDAVAAAVAVAAGDVGLDVAVNNAGAGHRPLPLGEFDLADFDRNVAVNLRGTASALHAELRHVADEASIVNVVSSAGHRAAPGMSAYAAAKHGVVGLTRVAAVDYAARGIRVNAVAPGPIESGPVMEQPAQVRAQIGRYVPLGRMGTADDVAEAVLWLASPASCFVTGALIPVDGGKTAF